MGSMRESIRVFAGKELSPAARSAKLAAAAQHARTDAIASGRASPRYRTYTDGREGVAETAVRKSILYEYDYLGPAIEYALAFLIARSPAKSGRYRAGFVVGVNGRQIPARQFIARAVPNSAEVLIFNRKPYSRKVDTQLIGNKKLHYSVPPGLFDDVAKAVRQRFGNSLTAKRLYTVKFAGQGTNRRGKFIESPALSLKSL